MTIAIPEHRQVDPWQEPDPAMPNPARQAHSLHLAGEAWASIATRVGYASAKVCAMAVKRYLERAAVEQGPDQRREQLDLERARFDALQAPYWQLALDGDIKAAQFVLKVISARARMLGLAEVAASNQAEPTLIITGSQDEFIAGMQGLIARREAAKHPLTDAPDNGDASIEPLDDSLTPPLSDPEQVWETSCTNLVV